MTEAAKGGESDNPASTPATVDNEAVRDDNNKAVTPGRVTILVAAVALLVAITAIAGGGWLWWQFDQARQQLAAREQQDDRSRENLQQSITELQQNISRNRTTSQSDFSTFQDQIESELARLRSDMHDAKGPDWLLAEAEYLIRIANHRLQLERDPDTAMVALQLADARLRSINSPELTEVRRRLAEDIASLKAMPRLDVEGLSLTLASLQRRVEQLPINVPLDREAQDAEQAKLEGGGKEKSWWRKFFSDVWHTLTSLVSVRRLDDKTEAVAVPEQRAYLRQNLALKLEAARYAVLRRDDNAYHDNLAVVRDWLQRYFDKRASEVMAMQETLGRLDKQKLDQPLPSVTASLQAIEQLKKSRLSSSEQMPAENAAAESKSQ